jgi:hypothetical protein
VHSCISALQPTSHPIDERPSHDLFEFDILGQADALAAFAVEPLPGAVAKLDFASFDRIILTGMGSSDYATLGFELMLAARPTGLAFTDQPSP